MTAKGLKDRAVEDLVVQGEKLDTRIAEAILEEGCVLERSMSMATQLRLSLADDRRELVRAGALQRSYTVMLDGLTFEITGYAKRGNALEVTMLSKGIVDLKRVKGPRSADGLDRTPFARSLVRSVRYLDFEGEPSGESPRRLGLKARENGWHGLNRLAADRQWRCFEAEGTVFFGGDEWLAGLLPPIAITEDDDGIEWIDYELTRGDKASLATVTCRAAMWDLRPGAPVYIEDLGESAEGLWLVDTIRRGLFSTTATVTLIRKVAELPEPRPGGGGGGIGGPVVYDTDNPLVKTCPIEGAIAGEDFTDTYGAPRPNGRTHEGQDIFANEGTPVRATHDGRFEKDSNNLGGIVAKVFLPNGDYTYYAHLKGYAAVAHGAQVKAGTVIAYVDHTGNARDTDDHLHFGTYVDGKAKNPYPALAYVCGGKGKPVDPTGRPEIPTTGTLTSDQIVALAYWALVKGGLPAGARNTIEVATVMTAIGLCESSGQIAPAPVWCINSYCYGLWQMNEGLAAKLNDPFVAARHMAKSFTRTGYRYWGCGPDHVGSYLDHMPEARRAARRVFG